jgi:hypothetical protein
MVGISNNKGMRGGGCTCPSLLLVVMVMDHGLWCLVVVVVVGWVVWVEQTERGKWFR